MTLLFDTSPEEPTKKRGGGKRTSAPIASEKQEVKKEPYYLGQMPARAIKPIGRLDDTYQCVDARCGAACHDILMEDKGEWLLQCCFCNCTQWLPAIAGHLVPREEQFVLRDGRFAGLTLDEVAGQPLGMDYITWAAEEHKRDAVKAACKTWLDHRNGPR
jgi:hypothetical protein